MKTKRIALLLLIAGIGASKTYAQEQPTPKADSPVVAGVAVSGRQTESLAKQEHRFWDKKNAWLFAGVGAARTADYFSTLNMRRRGRQEILLTNDLVDNHAAFAVVEAAGAGLSIGASYLFHHYGHHKLERWTSMVHIGLATAGAATNYSLETVHRKAAP